MMLKRWLMLSSAVSACWGAPALAQDGQASAEQQQPQAESEQADAGAGDIVVVAQKYEQKLQDVPLAVSAFTSRMRDEIGLANQQQIAAFTPGMSYSNDPSRVYLRGIGRTTSARNSDPGVGIYYDGVYSVSAAAIATPNIITERVEILRGPQGTLYGKNTTGGAVNVISKRPTEEFTGEFRQNLGNYERSESGLTLSGPLSDAIRYRVTGTYNWQGDGYTHNVAGRDFGTGENYSIESQIEADVTSNLQVWMKYQYARANQIGGTASYTQPYNTAADSLNGFLTINPAFGYTVPNPGITDPRSAAKNTDQRIRTRTHNLVGHVDWEIGDNTTLRYIGGYTTTKASIVSDLDNTARTEPFLYTGILSGLCDPVTQTGCLISPVDVGIIGSKASQYSNELNLISSGNEAVDFVLGLYQYHDSQSFDTDLRRPEQVALNPDLLANNPTGTYIHVHGRQSNTTYAGFGQVDYHLNDQLTLQTGARYTYDRKRVSDGIDRFAFFSPIGILSPDDGGCGAYFCDFLLNLPESSLERTYEGWSGKLALQWQPDRATNVFALVSRGYKSGAIINSALGDTIPDETLMDYEIGVKRSFGRKLSVSLAAFYYDYKNQQIETIGPDPTIPGNYKSVFVSAPKSRVYGFETEVNWKITDHLDALLSYSYLNAKITKLSGLTDFADPDAGPQDLSGNRMPQSPRNKVAANIGYTFDFAPGSLRLSGNYIYTSTKYFDIFTTPTYRGKPFHQVDLRALFTDKDDRFTVIGYVTNLLNKDAINYVSIVNGTSFTNRSLNDPRTYGVELQVRF